MPRPPRFPRVVFLAAYWLALATLTVFALLPLDVRVPTTGWDKANHTLAFAIVTGLGLRCWPRLPARLAAGMFLYGIAIEVAQTFTPTRTGDWADVVADSIGVLLALLLGMAWRRRSASASAS